MFLNVSCLVSINPDIKLRFPGYPYYKTCENEKNFNSILELGNVRDSDFTV